MKKMTKSFVLIIFFNIFTLLCSAQKVVFDYDYFNSNLNENYTDPSDGKKAVYLPMKIKVYGYKGEKLYTRWYFYERGKNMVKRIMPGSILAPNSIKEKGQLQSISYCISIPNNQETYSLHSFWFAIPRDCFPRYCFREFNGNVLAELVVTNSSGKEIARSKCCQLDFRLNNDKTSFVKYNNDNILSPTTIREEPDGIVYHEQKTKCHSCGGTSNCSLCRGLGTRLVGYRNPYTTQCTSCHGRGKCSYCNGGYVTKSFKYYLNKDKEPAYIPPASSSFENSTGNNGYSYSSGSTLCNLCGGSGKHTKCLGKGYYYDDVWTHENRKCFCVNGICPACNGKEKK